MYMCTYVCVHVYMQVGRTLLFAAACSGSVQLFEWLLQKYDLAPDKWDIVSAAPVLYIHKPHLCASVAVHSCSVSIHIQSVCVASTIYATYIVSMKYRLAQKTKVGS